jgi:hypothetical protein
MGRWGRSVRIKKSPPNPLKFLIYGKHTIPAVWHSIKLNKWRLTSRSSTLKTASDVAPQLRLIKEKRKKITKRCRSRVQLVKDMSDLFVVPKRLNDGPELSRYGIFHEHKLLINPQKSGCKLVNCHPLSASERDKGRLFACICGDVIQIPVPPC